MNNITQTLQERLNKLAFQKLKENNLVMDQSEWDMYLGRIDINVKQNLCNVLASFKYLGESTKAVLFNELLKELSLKSITLNVIEDYIIKIDIKLNELVERINLLEQCKVESI